MPVERLPAWPALRIPRMPELLAPAPLLATVVLALNDHVFKARFPGLVTGKLSDLAGCFVLPLFISAALALATRWPQKRRLAVGVAATVVLFSAVKLSPWAAGVTVRALDAVWGALTGARDHLVADPTDLVALPFAFLAYAFGRRAGGRAGGEDHERESEGARRRSAGRDGAGGADAAGVE